MKPQRFRPTLIATAIAFLLPGAAQAVRVDYGIDLGYERDDNVALSATDPIEQNIARLGLGFTIQQDSSAVQASIIGRIDHRRYEEPYDPATDSMLEGRLNWMILPDRLAFVVEDSYDVQAVDPFEPDAPDNRQQVNVLSLGPTLYFNMGQTLTGQAEVRYIDSSAEITDAFNSSRVLAALRVIKSLDANSALSFNLQGQDVDFDDDIAARDHRRTEAFGSYERKFNLFDTRIDAGYSRLEYDDGASEGNPLFRAQGGWTPTERSRFFVRAASQYSDAASGALASIGETSGIPTSIVAGTTTLTPSAYKERRVGGGYEYTGSRATWSLASEVSKIEYLDIGPSNERIRGGTAALNYRLSTTLSLGASIGSNRIEYEVPANRVERDRHHGVSLSRQWSRHWRSSVGVSRYSRSSSLAGADFDRDLVYLTVSYNNR